MPSTFDVQAFLQSRVTGKLATKIVQPPDGEYMPAQITKVAARLATMKDGSEQVALDLTWTILDEKAIKATKNERPQARESFFIEFTPQGAIDMTEGHNIRLGRVREAVGQNNAKDWMPAMLEGATTLPACGVKTRQRPDEKDPETVYCDVVRVLLPKKP